MQKMIVKKPWGTYEVLLDEPTYKVKRIVVHPYERFSLQYHKHREEHWVVVEGDGIVQVNEKEYPAYVRTHWVIVEGDGIVQVKKKEYPAIVRSHWVILPRELHRATAGPNGLIFIETQTGDCREEDIVRLEDDYGRLDSSEVSV